MNSQVITIEAPPAGIRRRVADYLALAKPRVVAMVLVTSLAGYYLGAASSMNLVLALKLLGGTAAAAGGTLALNQYLERDLDSVMTRTRARPLPAGRLYPIEALIFGAAAMIIGCAYLALAVNWLTGLITALVAFFYLGGYTPLKRVTWLCNLFGAVPGALPPVAGWAAATGTLSAEPFILFAIIYLWQLPHTLAIARICEDDYTRAGIHLLPPSGPAGWAANALLAVDCVALLIVGMLPAIMGFAGHVYLLFAAMLGAGFCFYGLRLVASPSNRQAAKNAMFASLVYLPAILLALVVAKI